MVWRDGGAWLCRWLLLGAFAAAQPPEATRPCPLERQHAVASPRLDPRDKQEKVSVHFRNEVHVPLHVFWCDYDGIEQEIDTLQVGEEVSYSTYHANIFNVRTVKTGRLMHSLEVWPPQLVRADVKPCIELERDELGLDVSRWPEFQRLAAAGAGDAGAATGAAGAPCQGQDSKQWSCTRDVPAQEVEGRQVELYGLTAEEAEGTRHAAGATLDPRHRAHRKHLPNVTEYHSGFLKMQMTEKLKELLKFYETRKAAHTKPHGHIHGNITNAHMVAVDRVHLEHFPEQHRMVVGEMQQVLEWWTQTHLKHTHTGGIRVYRRGATVLNHMDRKESHLVSAVLQIAQVVDQDGGWPFELIHPHRAGVMEVYLQPGEMLLYEGARLEHGRPMRFRGEEFANVFSHFIPADYRGPKKEWINPHLEEL